MKKLIIVLLLCILNIPSNLFAQDKDSLAQAEEIRRFNRMSDSLHKLQLANDSAWQAKLDESARDLQRSMEERKQKEIEAATAEVMQRQEKEQGTKRKTMLWATAAFLVTLAAARILFKRKKRKID
jgi:hypothetical protein